MKENLSISECQTMIKKSEPMFAAKTPFDQVCNVVLSLAVLFFAAKARDLRAEMNKPQDRGS